MPKQLETDWPGIHNYHDNYRRFPAGISVGFGNASGSGSIDPAVCPRCQAPPLPGVWGSWLTMILPYVEQDNLYKELDLSKHANTPTAMARPPLAPR